MSNTLMKPLNAAYYISPVFSKWSNINNLLVNDVVGARLEADAAVVDDYVRAFNFDTHPPLTDDVVGIEINTRMALVSDFSFPQSQIEGYVYTMEIGISKTASATGVPLWKRFTFVTAKGVGDTYYPPITVGGITDLWGHASLTGADVAAASMFVRKPSTPISGQPEDTFQARFVDFVEMEVYHNASGGSLTVSNREQVRQKIYYGNEVTPGTVVTASKRLQWATFTPSPATDWQEVRPQGNILPGHEMLIKEWATGAVSGTPMYDEIGVLAASAIQKPVSTGGVADVLNTHVFRLEAFGGAPIQTYTFEYGEKISRAHRVPYGFFPQFGVNMNRSNPELNGQFVGQNLTDGITMSNGANEVQTFTIGATGGTFYLWFKGARTAAIALPTTAAAVATALNALSTIGASGVVGSGAVGAPVMTFSGTAMAGQAQPLIEIDATSATGGTVTVARTTVGGQTEMPGVPIFPGHVSVYLADTYAGLSAGKLTYASMLNWSIGDRFDTHWVLDAAIGSFKTHAEKPANAKFNLTLQADSNGMALMANAKANSKKYIRWEAVGPIIGVTTDVHKLTIDACVKVSAVGPLEIGGVLTEMAYELSAIYDTAWGNSLVMTLQNGITGY